jgi:predicted DCC family thiol-disulfide oxidoreductase YuxK
MSEPTLSVIYDGQCPFCANFVRWYRLRENVGAVALVDARCEPALVRQLRSMGMEVNEGMIVRWQGQYHFGADAMRLLAQLAAARGPFGRLNHLMFHNPTAAALLYPLLTTGRRLTLWLLGRPRVE